MKKFAVIIIISILSLALVVSWSFFFLQKHETSKLEIIDTKTEAEELGRVYLEAAYPNLRQNSERFGYMALFYSDYGENGLWAVCAYDLEEEIPGYQLPVVTFAKNGEIDNIALQAD